MHAVGRSGAEGVLLSSETVSRQNEDFMKVETPVHKIPIKREREREREGEIERDT